MQCTAVYQKRKNWYIGWVEEVPGVNSQGKTLKETKENLKEALTMIIEANRDVVHRSRPRGKVIRQKLMV